ncbi:MAG: DUF2301 domain-containing membrane protein [Nitrospirota bacterium]
MGEKNYFQPLTKEDKNSVILYRVGIFISTLIISVSAFIAVKSVADSGLWDYPFIISGLGMNILLLTLYFSVGMSVFFIHLYVGKFHRMLKKIYYVAVVCLAVLFFTGNGNPVMPLFRFPPYGALLLIPLSLCLGFITAKEAFCFKLIEGYLLAMIMPAYLFLYGTGVLYQRNAAFGLALIAAMLVFFTFRKVFMPIHYDIGDKSAYQP